MLILGVRPGPHGSEILHYRYTQRRTETPVAAPTRSGLLNFYTKLLTDPAGDLEQTRNFLVALHSWPNFSTFHLDAGARIPRSKRTHQRNNATLLFGDKNLTSTSASAATTLCRVPPRTTPTLTVVPASESL